ncbi:hypothetical protein C7N43_27225 [Sphingobacteriales bacterium UPWRP_1]|nr:hypothetical protein C7N43_27225 [Sphingobacteriales bacterium UPWRP_1]
MKYALSVLLLFILLTQTQCSWNLPLLDCESGVIDTTTVSCGSFVEVNSQLSCRSEQHESILLPNNKVLIISGFRCSKNSGSEAELYDVNTGNVTEIPNSPIGSLGQAYVSIPNGDVLLIGGTKANTQNYRDSTVYLYSYSDNAFEVVGYLKKARRYHTATLLNSTKILIVGGEGNLDNLKDVELYDVVTHTSTVITTLTEQLMRHTATKLENGSVLICGGVKSSTNQSALKNAYLYQNNVITPISGGMGSARVYHKSVLLQDGKVIILGGADGLPLNNISNTIEMYDPSTQDFNVIGTLGLGRIFFAVSYDVFANCPLLIFGGRIASSPVSSAISIDPSNFIAKQLDLQMQQARERCSAVQLPNGVILLTGGDSADGKSIEKYIPE